MTSRPYQQEALEKSAAEFKAGVCRQAVEWATGLGKTFFIAKLPEAIKLDRRGLIIAHREELVQQAREKLLRWAPGLTVGIEMGALEARNDDQIVIGSPQTMGKYATKRLLKYKPQDFGLIVTDEGHHAAANSYKNIYNYMGVGSRPDLLHVGVSATLVRADGKPLSNVYDKIVDQRNILFGINEGWLADVKGIRVYSKSNLDHVGVSKGDFTTGELEREVNTAERNNLIVREWMKNAGDRLTIAFCVDVQHAKDLAAAFEAHGIAAKAIWGGDPERKAKLLAHKQGKFQVLCNCEILTEGYDEWRVRCIVCARPTKSSGLYCQMIGRGTRIPDNIWNLKESMAEGVVPAKTDCLIIDVVDNSKRHSLNNISTLFGVGEALDPKGKSLVQIAAEIEEAKTARPNADLSQLKDIDNLESFVEAADLFAVEFPPEIIQISEYQWHRGRDGAYILLLAKDDKVVVLKSDKGEWRIWGRVNGAEINEPSVSFEAAIRHADNLVKVMGGRSLASLAKRKASWHDEPPTAGQIGQCKRFGIQILPGATKGQIHLVLQKKLFEIKERRAV